MNWDAIGAIGEIIGAVAVVVSIIYLAAQIRQNTKTVAANTFQSVSGVASSQSLRLAESPHIARLLVKIIIGGEELTPEENMEAQLVFRAIFRNYENYYYQYTRGNFEEEVWEGYRKTMSEQLAMKFGRLWWTNHQSAFGKSFVDFVNDELVGRDPGDIPWKATHESKVT